MSGQAERIYNWSWKNDGITLGVSAVAWGTTIHMKNVADKATLEEVMALDRNDVWAFDRGATDNNSEYARSLSNVLLFGSLAVPFFPIADKRCEGNTGAVIGMAFEAYLITDAITNLFKATTKRYRPFNYNPIILIEEKLTNTSRQSFISGHTSITAMASFYSAKIITDLHPDSKLKPLVWTVAAFIPALTGYLRYEGGRHFPTDILAGYGVGAAVGYLIPHFHKNKKDGMRLDLSMGPYGVVVGLNKNF